jgi:hypothetical protein
VTLVLVAVVVIAAIVFVLRLAYTVVPRLREVRR